jgi:ribosomal protein S18 acetylase RimI-like enzyme
MIPAIDIQRMDLTNVAALQKTCCEIYSQSFYTHWDEGGLQQYIAKVFGADTLKVELADKNILYYVAFMNRDPVGFMKINLLSSLPGVQMEKGIELDKIYVSPRYKRMKVGERLLNLAFDIAANNGKEIFWLSVIDTNNEAISFYQNAGFKFHSKTRLNYPKFKEELKGMWRMYFQLPRLDVT